MWLNDLRIALRSLLRAPGFTVVAVLTLGIAVGANSAIFSVIDGVLLRPLPFPEADRLVRVYNAPPAEGLTVVAGSFSPQDFEDLEREQTSFSNLAAFLTDNIQLVGGQGPQDVPAAYVSGDFFGTLGASAMMGRALLPGDDVVGADRQVVLSHGFWEQQFGSDPGVVGQSVEVGDEPYEIVGVMPEGFGLPDPSVRVWAPISLITDDGIPHIRGLRWMSVIGRLGNGASEESALADAGSVMRRLESMYPDSNEGWGVVRIESLHESIVGGVRPALIALLGTVVLILLISCANLANLVIARGISRNRETAARVMLGASRSRLLRHNLSEGLVLGLAGGIVGFVIALQAVPAIVKFGGAAIPRSEALQPDVRIALITLVLGIATAVLFSLAPALRAMKTSPESALREGGNRTTGSKASGRARSLLLTGQTALALTLLAGAGLMVRSLIRLGDVDPGFVKENLLVVALPRQVDTDADRIRMLADREEMIERVSALPGVVAAGGSKTLPLEGGGEPYEFVIPGVTRELAVTPEAGTWIVTPGYFRALGIPLIAGETLSGSAEVAEVVISETLARRYWPDGAAVGRVLRLGTTDFRIVGVAADVRTEGIRETPAPTVYVLNAAFPRSAFHLFVRTDSDPMRVAGAVRSVIEAVDPMQPIPTMMSMEQAVSAATADSRFLTGLLTLFAGIALLLATLGVYGVTAFMVTQRTSEIGIRMALGAARVDVLRHVVGQTMLVISAGVVVGLPLALLASRALGGLLFNVGPRDPLTFAVAVISLVLAALMAAQLPARRASRVDPMTALRT